MANNLPSNLKRHTMFRDKPYSHKVNFPDGFPMPSLITAEVRKGSKVIPGITPEISITGQSFTFTYQPSTLAKIRGLYDQYYLFDGQQYLGGEINTVVQIGDPDGGETNVVIAGDTVTTIQIPGLDVTEGKLQEVLTVAAGVVTAGSEIETKRQEVAGNTQVVLEAAQEFDETKRVKLASFAAVLPLCIANKPRLFSVNVDETLGNSVHVPYRWDGAILFMYDIYPSSIQPTL